MTSVSRRLDGFAICHAISALRRRTIDRTRRRVGGFSLWPGLGHGWQKTSSAVAAIMPSLETSPSGGSNNRQEASGPEGREVMASGSAAWFYYYFYCCEWSVGVSWRMSTFYYYLDSFDGKEILNFFRWRKRFTDLKTSSL